MKPLVSILITNFNKQKYIKKCIESCLNQNFRKFEICVADNNSTDNSIEVINKFKNKVRIFKIPRKFNSGPQNQLYCIKKMIKKSNGKIICLLDSDDFFYKNKLKTVFYSFKNTNSKFFFDKPYLGNKINFKIKNKKSKHIWPTIFPTSSISFVKRDFNNFEKLSFLTNKKFSYLAIDFRIQVYSMLIKNDYKILKNKITYYRQLEGGLESNWKKFSLAWWNRRYQAHTYLRKLYKIKNKKINKNFDFLISKMLSKFS
tara:strand:+ start:118 stop:891 length:774 start_codon:yes stop_codon:yes gene_type:complete